RHLAALGVEGHRRHRARSRRSASRSQRPGRRIDVLWARVGPPCNGRIRRVAARREGYRGARRPHRGRSRIGCPEAIAAGLLPAVVDSFSRRFPRVVVSVKAADDLAPEFRPLRERSVDLVLGRSAESRLDDDLDAEVLYHDRVLVATSGRAPWARRRRVTLADLIEQPWLLFPENSWIDTRVNEAFRRSGVARPRSIVRAYSVHFCINMLVTDRFLASLAGSVLRFNASRFGLKILPVDLPAEPWPVE